MNEISKQIHEEITEEVFRQILINNRIANAYCMLFNDNYEYQKNELGPIGGMIYIYKDNNNIWNVREDEPYEIFQGYIRGEHTDFRQYITQNEAYIDAARRGNINISVEDLTYDINDTESMLNIIKSAKEFLKFGIDFYRLEDKQTKLWQRYLLLNEFESDY